MRQVSYLVGAEAAGATVAHFLRRRGYSRALLTALKAAPDGLTVAGERVFTVRRLEAGETLTVRVPDDEPSAGVSPVAMPLTVVYEDADLFVIDKPAGMAVHPSQGNRESALANGLAALCAARGEALTFRAVGRLDKNTSGLVLVAKNALSGCLLSSMAARGGVRREYLAVCEGELPPRGVIDAPIGRAPGSALRREVRADGAPAVTHYERLEVRNGLSLARVWLETGRTHQIRVHMAHIGHPLPGDFLYHPTDARLPRHALHAASLTLRQPVTEAPLTFTSPLPADLAALLR